MVKIDTSTDSRVVLETVEEVSNSCNRNYDIKTSLKHLLIVAKVCFEVLRGLFCLFLKEKMNQICYVIQVFVCLNIW